MTNDELAMFGNSAQFQALAIADAIDKRDPTLLQPKIDECKFCSYRPKPRKDKKGCRFYVKPPKEAD